MSINAIGNSAVNNNPADLNNLRNVNDLSKIGNVSGEVKNAAAADKVAQKAVRQDTFVKSKENTDPNATGIYSRDSIVQQLKDAEAQRTQAFQETIQKMAAQQGLGINLRFMGQDLHVTKEQSEAAQKSIEDGGEYSVENVAGRIMDMAKALAGGDESKLEVLKNAVIKGFEGAAGKLGKKSLDEMPDITKKTYDNVMKQFDDWKKSFDTNADKKTMQNTVTQEITQQAFRQQQAKAPETNIAAQTEAATTMTA